VSALQDVQLELREMRKLGLLVPPAAFTVMSEREAQGYRDNGMKVGEIADLAIQLAQVRPYSATGGER
jgi:hypothetical protein